MKVATKVLILLLALGVMSCNRPQANPTVVLIVRHAEKASDAEDSPLTESGVQRAQALVRVALDAGVSAIYSSQFKRNRDTAQPISERLGVAVTERPVNLQAPGDYGKALAREIIENHAGQTILVVGHGNTIASTVEGLTGRASGIESPAYGDLFVVVLPPAGAARVVRAQYGL